MSFRICCFSLLLLHLPSRAAEIVGWKIPLSQYLDDGTPVDELEKLKNPPEASPFFHPGDQLHQLRNVSKDGKPIAEWIVWNATTGRLVVKGSLPAIRRVRNKIEAERMPAHVRLSFGIYDYPVDGAMPDDKAVPLHRHAFVVRSGQVMEYESRDETFTFNFNGEAHFQEIIGEDLSQSPVELRGVFDVTTKDQGRLKISNTAVLSAGGSVWLAGDTDGKDGMMVKLKADPVLSDGSPWREKLLRQRAGKTEPFVLDPGVIGNRQIDERWFSSWPLSEERLAGLLGSDDYAPPPQVDPFENQAKLEGIYSAYPEIPAPASLSQWIDLPVRDVTAVVHAVGITTEQGDFFGYDPEQELLFSYTKNENTADLLEVLFTPACQLRWQPAITITVEGGRRSHLLGRGGSKATLERIAADGAVMQALEIEPSIGESGEIIDARLSLFDQRNPAVKGSLKTSVCLGKGEFSEIWRDASSGGQTNVLRVKADWERR